MPAAAEETEILAVLERCVFASSGDEPFAVWMVRELNGADRFRAAGALGAEQWGEAGNTVRLVGRWVDDPRYGRQFRVTSIRPDIPKGAAGILRWLAEQPGIGPKTALKVVSRLGADDLLGRIAADPAILKEARLTARQRQAVVAAAKRFQEDRDRESVLEWCYRHGLSPWQAEAVFEAYGEAAPSVLSASPWELAWLPRFSCLTADALARSLGADPASPARLRAALVYVLEKAAAEEGHVFLPKDEWLQRALDTLCQAAERDGYGRGLAGQIREGLPAAAAALARAERERDNDRWEEDHPPIVVDGQRVYLERLWRAQQSVKRWLQQRAQARGLCSEEEARDLAAVAEGRGNLDEVQASAVVKALASGAMVLTGGPGTGKTTVTRAILSALRNKLGDRFEPLLCAPTGRAAKRLAEVTGVEASTIHRLLEFHPEEGFLWNADTPLEGDFLIADEMSMTDMPLFAALVEAIPPEMPVLPVGDADQLPPVGPGAPFHEIVGRELLPVVRLHRVYRQDAGGPIAQAAQAVNWGRVPPLEDQGGHYRVQVFPRAPADLPKPERERRGRETRERMAGAVEEAVRQLLLGGWRPDEIQVLTPIKRGPLGTHELNHHLRLILNREMRDPEKDVFRTQGGREIWLGDRVIQTVNDYDLGVFNGKAAAS